MADFNKAIERNSNFASAYYNRGNVYYNSGDYDKAIENYNKAIDYYKQAIDFEANFSNSITNSYLSYSELIFKTQRTDLYNDLEKTLLEERYSLSTNFPVAKYIGYSVLSIINKHKGDIEKAKYYAVLAEQNATALESGFNNHKTLGLVRERDKLLDKLMYE